MLYRFTIQTAGILMVAILVGTAQADSVVQINLNGQVNGLFGLFHSFQVQLLDSQAPITVDNYLNYINSDRYDNTIIHRDIHNFVMQGGG
ncbi:MAG TPA: peptidylprolyl isomerase, partial [Thermoguttaceae bacterium]